MPGHAELAAAFDRSNPARLTSEGLERIWRAAYGEHYPEEVRPNAFYPAEVMATVERLIGSAPDQLLADLGCGHGGAGLRLAQRLGMRLVGIDLSPASVAAARERALALGLGGRADFHVDDIAATGLEDGACAAAISLDVLLYMPDKPAALREAARILRPGGLFAFTTWEQEGYSDRLGAAQIADHRPLLEAAGFDVEVFEEPQGWRGQQQGVLQAAVAQERDLSAEIGAEAASFLANMARGALEELPARRYVFAAGRRRRDRHA